MGLQLVHQMVPEKGLGGSYGLEKGLPGAPYGLGKGLLAAVSASGWTSTVGFLDGVFLVSVLECKGVLKVTCFDFWFVCDGVYHCMGTGFIWHLKFNDSQMDRCRIGQQSKGPCGVLRTCRYEKGMTSGEVLYWTTIVKKPKNRLGFTIMW